MQKNTLKNLNYVSKLILLCRLQLILFSDVDFCLKMLIVLAKCVAVLCNMYIKCLFIQVFSVFALLAN